MSNGHAEVLCRDKLKEEVSELKAESVTGMYVVTQLGLHVVYFCPFAGTGPLDDVL